jgi:hypothetical protein
LPPGAAGERRGHVLEAGWLPPGLPGYDEAGGPKQDADLDYLANTKGDPAVAKKYMLAAKQQDASLPIDANGRWTGSDKVLTITGNADPAKKTGEVFQNQMAQLGFKMNLRLVPADTLYGDQRGHAGGGRHADRPRAQQGVGQDRPHDRRAGAGGAVPVGQRRGGAVRGRRRRDQRLLHHARPQLHIARVAERGACGLAGGRGPTARPRRRSGSSRVWSAAALTACHAGYDVTDGLSRCTESRARPPVT